MLLLLLVLGEKMVEELLDGDVSVVGVLVGGTTVLCLNRMTISRGSSRGSRGSCRECDGFPET